MTRYARKVDDNHAAIRDAMRNEGVDVYDLSGAGNGVPDTVASYGGREGRSCFVEIKDGSKSASRRKLTTAQQRFFDNYKGPVVVIETEQQARDFARGLIAMVEGSWHEE